MERYFNSSLQLGCLHGSEGHEGQVHANFAGADGLGGLVVVGGKVNSIS